MPCGCVLDFLVTVRVPVMGLVDSDLVTLTSLPWRRRDMRDGLRVPVVVVVVVVLRVRAIVQDYVLSFSRCVSEIVGWWRSCSCVASGLGSWCLMERQKEERAFCTCLS